MSGGRLPRDLDETLFDEQVAPATEKTPERRPSGFVRAPAAPRAGAVFAGKYIVMREIARGGVGIVCEAVHSGLRERVAVKVLRPEAAKDPRLVDRLFREARAAARLRSEHVVRVIDAGRDDRGTPYLVMEHLEGSTLVDVVTRRGALPLGEAVDLVLQLLEALAEAHAKGVVHRDVKLSNLLLTERADGSQVLKLADFGIAKVDEDVPFARTDLTETDGLLGTPSYMSPEQRSDPKHVDARADVWSVGVTLHRLVTKRYPFEPGPPARQGIELPAVLEPILRLCLATDPKARYPSVAELAAALVPFGSSPQARLSASRIAKTLGRPEALALRASRSSHDPEATMRVRTRGQSAAWVALAAAATIALFAIGLAVGVLLAHT